MQIPITRRDMIVGGGLNFEVVGGAIQPDSPSENTIWVNTTDTITSWIFSAEQPSVPSQGMVWFFTGSTGNNSFDAITDNAIIVYPQSAYQYISSSWEKRSAVIYQSGIWASWWDGTLYDAGNEYEDITGGWFAENFASADNVGTLTKNADHMSVVNVTYANTGAVTNKVVNLSGYSTLHVTCKSSSSINVIIRVSTDFPDGNVVASLETTSTASTVTRSLAFGSNLNGYYKIGIRGQSTSTPLQIYKVWLT